MRLLLIAVAFFTACSSDGVEPIFEELQLQSIQLHYAYGQIDYDSMTYDNQGQLGQIVRESTGWSDRLVYDFEYQPTSTAVYLTQNGTPSTSFVRKEIFDPSGLLIQEILNKDDGTIFGTSDWTYNPDGTITVEKYGAQEQLMDVETIELDNNGNQIKVTYNNGNSVVIMEYDGKPNPFFKMGLQTAHFQTHSPNNQTRFQILQNGNLFFERNYQYQYAEGYPEQVESFSSLPNDVKETFYFYYR